ncbi:hypothetical protein KUTeg_019821 [Tegillarca granosa]|uniref:Uncharacterized protein n=1 Tax=Tegillarca granosa TaxID=220873 RepID=A0ABQ9EE44_TEGGR|nr:hypothetical protein KUTeg_019821 [Tegillarca granosa]
MSTSWLLVVKRYHGYGRTRLLYSVKRRYTTLAYIMYGVNKFMIQLPKYRSGTCSFSECTYFLQVHHAPDILFPLLFIYSICSFLTSATGRTMECALQMTYSDHNCVAHILNGDNFRNCGQILIKTWSGLKSFTLLKFTVIHLFVKLTLPQLKFIQQTAFSNTCTCNKIRSHCVQMNLMIIIVTTSHNI